MIAFVIGAVLLVFGYEAEHKVGPDGRDALGLGGKPGAQVSARAEVFQGACEQRGGETLAAVSGVRRYPVDKARRGVALGANLARGRRGQLTMPKHTVDSPDIRRSG
ncbi:MAG: hypothetical protein AVDCRST_MAG86-1106 [uncultured Truepera sp.]|uniref:Uncharacterized protein n=1 Tax=uncultured Truepera sp. TaxID=543023 RepID=A0A6J4V113_9DEIN|nr:MAG: hypothetical protein AVDCRST_MAG86-1106 [uncultured Truepera sp.]